MLGGEASGLLGDLVGVVLGLGIAVQQTQARFFSDQPDRLPRHTHAAFHLRAECGYLEELVQLGVKNMDESNDDGDGGDGKGVDKSGSSENPERCPHI